MKTTTTKLTYSQALEMVLNIQEVIENKELFEKITQLENQMNKKSGKMSKAEKEKQQENEEIKTEILAILEVAETPQSIKEIQLESNLLEQFSNQKISALLRQLIETLEVERTEEKRIAKFNLVGRNTLPVNSEDIEVNISL